MPVRGPGPPAPFCSDACMLSLAWLECLHLMVYSYSAVHDAVPRGAHRVGKLVEVSTGWARNYFSNRDERRGIYIFVYMTLKSKDFYQESRPFALRQHKNQFAYRLHPL